MSDVNDQRGKKFSPTNLIESIVKRGDRYLVTNKEKSKVLGKHSTRGQALKQLAAIEASKARRGK